jgi:predicted DNA-binding mobile mystery protein A
VKAAQTLARRRLDERLKAFSGLGAPPPMGWVRAIRDALGLTGAQLARRLNIRPASLSELEKNEASGRITLATLKRAAEALDCTFVYALVPKQSLEKTVEEAAKAAAQKELVAALHTMELEAQGVRAGDKREMLEALAADIAKAGGKRLWG